MTPLERAISAINNTAVVQNIAGDQNGVIGDEPLYVVTNPDAVARAVLEAIREPSEGMVREGCLADIPGGRFDEATFTEAHIGEQDAPVIWQAMIDAALTE